MREKITVTKLVEIKQRGEKITMLTAYDYLTAKLLDEMGVDLILVGDSLGMVVLGYENTLAVTMDDMIHHTKAVARGVKSSMVVGDMPFMSYQINADKALKNAGRFLQEAGAQAVKLEGGEEVADKVDKIVKAGIPVMGHLGLTPQSVHQMGGFKVQGKEDKQKKKLLKDAKILEEAGAFSIVLECVPKELAADITKAVSIPIIGIGAGCECDGQVLVTQDILGMYDKFVPKFVKQYAKLNSEMKKAVSDYISEVKTGKFPSEEHEFH
ncbi:3-methyl-2-oxobutanoate hydroxymethyltransferase [Candidatus Oleimmundimicrobium sp.]|uniref:3-methyl-2-oxobutanoate hydroxymethyltransferase n=1 Tax=Candidatus Oleimmundimicrobium sp. TaxID=3060597 RepID=UPI0027277802|nr:3-methyl-2-oxobutanoate hydroxymethyltransferase [Candidatus Oleimmundimicrobium sp.]MDO8885920.1 3-methyl-2-oxobutanoate hydroxymethyltransferase [Candidatus Oleimmundimicrobium sp.]